MSNKNGRINCEKKDEAFSNLRYNYNELFGTKDFSFIYSKGGSFKARKERNKSEVEKYKRDGEKENIKERINRKKRKNLRKKLVTALKNYIIKRG